jgi:hypothetical protein
MSQDQRQKAIFYVSMSFSDVKIEKNFKLTISTIKNEPFTSVLIPFFSFE